MLLILYFIWLVEHVVNLKHLEPKRVVQFTSQMEHTKYITKLYCTLDTSQSKLCKLHFVRLLLVHWIIPKTMEALSLPNELNGLWWMRYWTYIFSSITSRFTEYCGQEEVTTIHSVRAKVLVINKKSRKLGRWFFPEHPKMHSKIYQPSPQKEKLRPQFYSYRLKIQFLQNPTFFKFFYKSIYSLSAKIRPKSWPEIDHGYGKTFSIGLSFLLKPEKVKKL